jgi:hypothetical protein
MFSSARRGQVEPLPALLAVAAFAIALSLYGTSLEAVQLRPDPTVSDGAVEGTLATIAEGTVVYPGRLDRLDVGIDGPSHRSVVITAAGRTWRRGPRPPADAPSARRHVLVYTHNGTEPGTLRVIEWS